MLLRKVLWECTRRYPDKAGLCVAVFSPTPQPREPREWTGPREGLGERDQRGLHKAQRSHSSFAGLGLVAR